MSRVCKENQTEVYVIQLLLNPENGMDAEVARIATETGGIYTCLPWVVPARRGGRIRNSVSLSCALCWTRLSTCRVGLHQRDEIDRSGCLET